MLLAEMRAQRAHVAVVVDEHGTTAGLVTMEDLLEVIVGDDRGRTRRADRPRSRGSRREPGGRRIGVGAGAQRGVGHGAARIGRLRHGGGPDPRISWDRCRAEASDLEVAGRAITVKAMEGYRVARVSVGPPQPRRPGADAVNGQWRRARDSNPQRLAPGSFQGSCLTVRLALRRLAALWGLLGSSVRDTARWYRFARSSAWHHEHRPPPARRREAPGASRAVRPRGGAGRHPRRDRPRAAPRRSARHRRDRARAPGRGRDPARDPRGHQPPGHPRGDDRGGAEAALEDRRLRLLLGGAGGHRRSLPDHRRPRLPADGPGDRGDVPQRAHARSSGAARSPLAVGDVRDDDRFQSGIVGTAAHPVVGRHPAAGGGRGDRHPQPRPPPRGSVRGRGPPPRQGGGVLRRRRHPQGPAAREDPALRGAHGAAGGGRPGRLRRDAPPTTSSS